MIVCPACHAENPDGTKICVKCGTELPKAAATGAAKTKPVADDTKKFGVKDMGRDIIDILWVLLILSLVGFYFWMESTHWDLFAKVAEPKIASEPVVASVPHHINHVVRHEIIQSQSQTQIVGEKPAAEYGNPETFFEKGKKKFDERRYHESFNYLKQALMIDPTFAKAYFGLGYLYARFDMDDAAVRMYEMALRFDPNHADATNNLGMMYYHAGNYDDALQLFQKAAALNEQNADYEYNLGSVYLDKDQPDDALQAFQKALSIRPDDASIYNDLAVTYEKLGKKQEAMDTWQKVMEYSKDPDLTQNAKSHLDYLQTQS
jgi:Flp pilus assembly protein TadD